jgi:hypothetical protein
MAAEHQSDRARKDHLNKPRSTQRSNTIVVFRAVAKEIDHAEPIHQASTFSPTSGDFGGCVPTQQIPPECTDWLPLLTTSKTDFEPVSDEDASKNHEAVENGAL